MEGSPVDLKVQPKDEGFAKMRQDLIASGNLVEGKNGIATLRVTVSFKSPSGAASFVLGGANNGWIAWEDSEGKTLKELYR